MDEPEADEPEYLKCPCKECGNNIEYPAASARTTVTCPHCGQWTELRAPEPPIARKIINLGWLSIVCWLLFLAGIGIWLANFQRMAAKRADTPPATNTVAKTKPKTNAAPANIAPPQPLARTPSKPHPKSPADLIVGPVQLEKTKDTSLVYAVGTIENDSDFQRFGVAIELELKDAKGKTIGKTQDYKDILEPHKDWQFHALIPDAKAASAKVSAVKEQD